MPIAGRLVILRPGDIVECHELALGGARFKFDELPYEMAKDADPGPDGVPRNSGPLQVRQHPGSDGYDVIHPVTGRSINDLPLTQKVAVDLEGCVDTMSAKAHNRPGTTPGWKIPILWNSGTVFVFGGGPSLAGVDVNRLKGHRVIAVNNAYKLADWIDVMFYGDCRWLGGHADGLKRFSGLKMTTCPNHDSNLGRSIGIKVLAKRRQHGIHSQPDAVNWNLSSGACAINVAVHLGAKRIILLGYDMRRVDGRNNWHPDHITTKDHNPYARFLTPFPIIAADLRRLGVECVNATPGSALTVFPIVDPEEVLP